MERQFFSCILAIAALSTDSGLLVVNRFTLSSGTYKFPFPVTTTLIQNLISSVVIILIERLANLLLYHLTPRESIASLEADQEYLLRQDEKPQPCRTEAVRKRSPLRRSAIHQRLRHVCWRLIPVAFVYFAKVVLGNIFLARLPLNAYTVLRIAAIPLSFLLNSALGGDSPSALATCCLTAATLSVVLAMMPLSDMSIVDLLQGASLSTADALFPVVLLNAYDGHHEGQTTQGMASEQNGVRSTSRSLLRQTQEGCSNFWSILRHLSFQSTALLVVHALISGELRSIRESCYVLDVGILRWLLAAGGILNGTVLILTALLAMTTFPVTVTFLAAPLNAFQLAIFLYAGFNKYRWIGLSVCWVLGLAFIYFSSKEGPSNSTAATRYSLFMRNIIMIVALCGVLYVINGQGRGNEVSGGSEGPSCPSVLIAETKVPGPKALNRTRTNNDDYFGTRPHLDTIANLTFLVEHCREIEGASGVDDVVNCLSILEHEENKYFSHPKESPAARGNKINDVLKISNNDITDREPVVTHEDILVGDQTHAESFFGKCAGPVIPFHVYWTGSASWRVELFIKAYLYTQNLACSRLWLWLDSDLDANAVDRMLCHDPIFHRFRPLVASGDIVLKSWNFPDRVPLARASPETASPPATEPNLMTEDDETVLANGTIQDRNGQQWLPLKSTHASLAPVQVSDAVRFIVLHLHGGVYCDMDVLLLRDMRPLLLPDPLSNHPRPFAEQWVERCAPYDYNTAVISLPAYSPLSSYLLRGGVRMGMNFHPRVIGRMLWHDGRSDELSMLHNAVFDPLVTNLRREGTNTCTVPCHRNFESAFMGRVEEEGNEWSNYHGEQGEGGGMEGNRTLANFFRGAWAYHIHNQWWKFPEPTSWMDVITRAQDGFFDGSRTNAYGEWWGGPGVEGYDREGW